MRGKSCSGTEVFLHCLPRKFIGNPLEKQAMVAVKEIIGGHRLTAVDNFHGTCAFEKIADNRELKSALGCIALQGL